MNNCVFCGIIAGQIPATKVYEDDLVLAFLDIHPVAPVHVLIVPKEHLVDLSATENVQLLGHIQKIALQIATEKQVAGGYKIVLNGGKYQEIKHLHYHLLGGSDL